MAGKGKAHGSFLADVRALIESDPFLDEVDGKMIAECAVWALCFVAGVAILLFAAKGWVLTWY